MNISSTRPGVYRNPATSLGAGMGAALSDTAGFAPAQVNSPQAYQQRAQTRQISEDLTTFQAALSTLGEDATVGDVIGKMSKDIREARQDLLQAEKRVENRSRRSGLALIGSAGLVAAGVAGGLTGYLPTAWSVGLAGAGLAGMTVSGMAMNDPSPKLAVEALQGRVQRLEGVQDNMQMWVGQLSATGSPVTTNRSN